MGKAEYISMIEKSLVGKVSAQELHDTVTYYRDYIDMEVRKGRTEQEVLEQLGNPRLLAKSIIAAKGSKRDDELYRQEQAYEENDTHSGSTHIPLPVLILIIVLFFMMIFSAFISVVRFLLPVLLPLVLIIMVISWFRRRR